MTQVHFKIKSLELKLFLKKITEISHILTKQTNIWESFCRDNTLGIPANHK